MRSLISILLCLFFLSPFVKLFSQNQDTVRIMSYNLLNYRNNGINGCSGTNNNPTTKETDLTTIIDYALPDILVCNEIGTNDPAASFRVANNALNQSGRTYYSFTTMQTGTRQNNNSNATGNMIYWDNRKFELHDNRFIEFDPFNRALVRVIDLYTLYYKDPNLAVHGDTLFLHIFIAHLKAGNTSADRNEREWATDAVMAYLDSNNLQGNYFIAGDFNVYTATEPAYQNLINYPVTSLRFSDPLPIPAGSWSNNTAYAFTHTQSTRTVGGCGAGGGMDDRFDFILASDEVLNGTDSIEYLTGSYTALGQDGNRFNGSLTGSPANTSGVPNNVLQAMQNLSDHLPVQMDLILKLPQTTALDERLNTLNIHYTNPVDHLLSVSFDDHTAVDRIQLLNMAGQVIRELRPDRKEIEIDCATFQKGMYIIKVFDKKGISSTQKLIKI
jgi:hypothetical protein